MADIITRVFSVAEAKRQAKIYQEATKAMAEHCDERIATATKALKAIRTLANGPGDRRFVIDKIFGIATEAVRALNPPRSDRDTEQT